MEEMPKLWQNINITWKAGTPGQDVGLALTAVTTNCKEYDNKKMVVDISNEVLIKYLALNLNEDSVEDDAAEDKDGIGNLQDLVTNGKGEDDSDDDENITNSM